MSIPNIPNYELAPSPATIFGCLLPAPWLGMLTGLLLAFGNHQDLPNRFAPLSFALTHCLALGMLMPIMLGAIFQLMPVIGGQSVKQAKYLTPFIALGCTAIALGLTAGFLMQIPTGFIVAITVTTVLFGAITLFLTITAYRIKAIDATTRTLRWIVLPLAFVVILGILLASSLLGWQSFPFQTLLQMHMAWGLIGWILTLLLGVASTTVPMFWQIKKPSDTWQANFPQILLLPLLLIGLPMFGRFSAGLISCLVFLIAGNALYKIYYAKRKFDPAWQLWFVCALSWLIASLLLGLELTVVPEQGYLLDLYIPWWIGVLVLVGGSVLPINAMLGKIIPFLVFLHLRRQISPPKKVPTMQEIVTPQSIRLQGFLVLLALVLLLALPFSPDYLAYAAGLTFAASQGYLGWLLSKALLRYRKELLI